METAPDACGVAVGSVSVRYGGVRTCGAYGSWPGTARRMPGLLKSHAGTGFESGRCAIGFVRPMHPSGPLRRPDSASSGRCPLPKTAPAVTARPAVPSASPADATVGPLPGIGPYVGDRALIRYRVRVPLVLQWPTRPIYGGGRQSGAGRPMTEMCGRRDARISARVGGDGPARGDRAGQVMMGTDFVGGDRMSGDMVLALGQ